MNSYRVEYRFHTFVGTRAVDTDDEVHVNATSRENAVYAAFDAVSDEHPKRSVYLIGDVYLWDEENRWVLTHDHRTVSALVR